MEKLIEKLQNPFKGLTYNDVNGIQDRCFDIAKDLFENYSIECNNKTFRFAEIEFYYYKKVDSSNNFDADWNKETYPRNKNAGDLFFHYSGIDICFQCHFEEKEKNNEYGEFGGILIRSLYDENKKIIAGPLFCANTIMNACKENMPTLKPSDYHECALGKTLRYGISSDEKQEEGKKLYLCFYVTHVDNVELNWDKVSERIAWDKKRGVFKRQTRNYEKDRFNDNN